MGRPDILASFIDEAADRFPAEQVRPDPLRPRRRVVPAATSTPARPATSQLTVPDMRNGMIAGMQAAGIDKFDVLYHDSCLMSTYETASALGPLADAMVGSEEVIFGDSTLDLGGLRQRSART